MAADASFHDDLARVCDALEELVIERANESFYTLLVSEAKMSAAKLLAEHDRCRDALAGLRSAWNAHMATCPQHAALPDLSGPTWADLEAWRDAPSGTASGS